MRQIRFAPNWDQHGPTILLSRTKKETLFVLGLGEEPLVTRRLGRWGSMATSYKYHKFFGLFFNGIKTVQEALTCGKRLTSIPYSGWSRPTAFSTSNLMSLGQLVCFSIHPRGPSPHL